MDIQLTTEQIKINTKTSPLFPNFVDLKLDSRNILELVSTKFPAYSDFNFINLYAWDIDKDTQFSFLNNNLVLHCRDEKMEDKIYTILGNNFIDSSLEILLKYTTSIRLLPEISIESIQDVSKFNLKQDLNNRDYIFSTKDTFELKGEIYGKKRYLINRFHRKYPNVKTTSLNLELKQTQNDILQLLRQLSRSDNNITTHTYLRYEIRAIKRILDNINVFDLIAVGVYDKTNLIGFTISDRVNDNLAISPFLKVNKNYIGLSDFITKETAKTLYSKGILYLNTEQDLGIPGLRKYKNSWNPSFFLNKYIIEYN